ncbi:MAG: GDP-mannose 4,6-dehydratase [Candidatus Omnitrophica bacterium]|nr:GDP-mannose 4,6-dehydratase [Candidatus Omnitrophota bacterium]
MKILKNTKVLITGGGGFIASHLTKRLLEEGAKIFVLTKYGCVIDNIRLVNIWDKVKIIESDLRNPDSLKKVKLIKPDIIYHFAAYNHVGDSFDNVSEAIDVNSKGTVNLLDAYEDYKRFIYISSSEIYGHQSSVPFHEELKPSPISPYAVGKYSGELYARMKYLVYKRPIVILRPFNAFGPFQSPRAIIAEIIIKCLKGEDIVTTEGIQTRDFNYVENLIDGFLLASSVKKAVGEIINIGSGKEISIKELVKKIHKLADSKSKLCIGKMPYRPTEIWRMAASNKKASKLLGWRQKISFEEGLLRTINWYQKFKYLFEDKNSPLFQLCQKKII